MSHLNRRPLVVTLAAGLVVGLAACSNSQESPAEPDAEEPTALLSVIPRGGATDVDPTQPVVLEFDHPIVSGMEQYAALHEGDVTGPEVDGAWTLSEDRTELTFTPAQPLSPGTTYTIHLGGGMVDDHGHAVDLEEHGHGMGGDWATQSMMTSGMGQGMGGGMGPGQSEHMGEGWEHANGTFGMVFSFTTAAG